MHKTKRRDNQIGSSYQGLSAGSTQRQINRDNREPDETSDRSNGPSMRRSRLARERTRADRGSDAKHGPRAMRSVLVVSGQGKPTRYLGMDGWRLGIGVFFLSIGLVLSFLLGLFLHDVTAPHQDLWVLQHTQHSSRSKKTLPRFLSKFTATAKIMSKQQAEQRIRASKLATRLGLGTRAAAGRLLAGQVEPEWLKAAEEGWQIPKTLMWPVPEGWYVRGYGSGEAGYHLAVDIMGETGTAIRAVAPGIVAYSNNDVRGYGNMVILIHPGGWVTTYAHNSSNLVTAGERIGTGRTLALLGNTGISRGPHLHFEFIFEGNMCNPTPLFRPGVRHRYGSKFPIKQATWNPLGKRPTEIMCQRRRRHPRSYYYDLHPERSPYRNDEDLDPEEAISQDDENAESALTEGISEVEESAEELESSIPSDKNVSASKTPKSDEVKEQVSPQKERTVKKIAVDQMPETPATETPPTKTKPIEKPSDEKRTENKSAEETTAKSIGSEKVKPVRQAPVEEAPHTKSVKDKATKEELPEEETSSE